MITGVSVKGLEEVVWGFDRRAPFKSHTVASLVPPIFECYARIFNPARRLNGYGVSWREVAILNGRTPHALMNWEKITLPNNVSVTLEPLWVIPPLEGTLPYDVTLPLRRVLTRWSDRCCLGFWRGWGGPYAAYVPPTTWIDTGQQREYDLFIGPVTMLDFRFFGSRDDQTASVFWALNHRWWMIVDIDCITTYIGGDQEVIESLIECSELEVWPTHPGDDMTEESDRINV